MADEQSAPTGDRPGYEQAREELADVVRRLETGGASLEESLALWERGEALADHLPGVARRRPRPARRGGRRADDERPG